MASAGAIGKSIGSIAASPIATKYKRYCHQCTYFCNIGMFPYSLNPVQKGRYPTELRKVLNLPPA